MVLRGDEADKGGSTRHVDGRVRLRPQIVDLMLKLT